MSDPFYTVAIAAFLLSWTLCTIFLPEGDDMFRDTGEIDV